METYLQYRRIGKTLERQLNNDVEEPRKLPCLSQQRTRVVGDRQVLVVEWDGDDDPFNPRNWPRRKRALAVFVISTIAFIVGAAAPMDSAVLPQAAKDLHVSEVTESLAVGIFLVGFGFGALFAGPVSEVLGRSITYFVTMSSMCIWLMASALAPSIGPQLVFRFLAGFSGATPLVCAGGSISDMFTPLETTYVFPIFAICGFGGPVLGPVVSFTLLVHGHLRGPPLTVRPITSTADNVADGCLDTTVTLLAYMAMVRMVRTPHSWCGSEPHLLLPTRNLPPNITVLESKASPASLR